MGQAIRDKRNRFPGRLVSAVAMMLLALCSSGCGGGGLSPVSGKVTLDGQPAANLQVTFMPESEGGASFAQTDSSGQYSLTHVSGANGAIPGSHLVTIKEVDQEEEVYAPEVETNERKVVKPKPATPSRIPARYNSQSELRETVKEGANEIDFELTSQ
ncbi:MAG: carboxypeptidase-like regulatory domain-containing protein [Planctomycetes bacterium]|nr:carboxypeptidase-like regulatory domain-containing protein [Planctomycetota bacterium]